MSVPPSASPPLRVEVLGGGPGGMYAARLIKLRHPTWSVRVRERNHPDATFGFGIGLSPHTLRRMQLADPETYEALLAIGHELRTWKMQIGPAAISGGDNQSIGLGRADLLGVLAHHAGAVGVEIEWGTVADLDQVVGADLVIAADGASSATRARLSELLGATVEAGDLAYIWCGADIELDTMLFEVAETEHGIFVAHAMPFGPGRSTFQVDARLETVRSAGLAGGTTDSRGNDTAALDYLSAAFGRLLGSVRLRGNRSVWSTFNTVRCQSWSTGNVVLIGDAAHTAHYSVGSGTRMAMEDALALADAIDAHAEVPTALHAYEEARRPSTDRLQHRALRSQAWWASFPDRMHLPLPQLMTNFQTRTGALGATALAAADADLATAALGLLAQGAPPAGDDLSRQILDCPLDLARTTLSDRIVVIDDETVLAVPADVSDVAQARERHPACVILATAAADQTVTGELAEKVQGAGADAVLLAVASHNGDVMACLDAAERIRLGSGVPVAVSGATADLDLMSAGVLAGRLDLVSISDEETR
jgi:anthraniloyl-CoA monooxygenase